MMRRRLVIAGAAALTLIAAFVAGRFAAPTKTVTTNVLDERLVAQAVEAARADWKRDVVDHTVRRTIYRDGKPVERLVYVDREIRASGTSSTASGQRVEAQRHEEAKKSTTLRPDWRASVAAGWDPKALALKPEVYEGRVERRVLGTVWLGAWGRTDRTAGVSLGVEW